MGEFIEWDAVQPAVRKRLMIVNANDTGGTRSAEVDDLRRACEAVGLTVVDHNETATRAELTAEISTLRAQLAEAEADALTPTEGRATDEELEQIVREVSTRCEGYRDMALAVAARVRRERPACLVERLLAREAEYDAKYPTATLDRAYRDGHAAGYAEAVADVVAMLEEQMSGLATKANVFRYVRSLLNRLHTSAHVGAAKKGAT